MSIYLSLFSPFECAVLIRNYQVLQLQHLRVRFDSARRQDRLHLPIQALEEYRKADVELISCKSVRKADRDGMRRVVKVSAAVAVMISDPVSRLITMVITCS